MRDLLLIPSPTGFTKRATDWLEAELRSVGATPKLTRKGAVTWTLPGGNGAPRAVAAHVDTLGAMVKEVRYNGRLRLTQLGGYDWNTVEGEHCTVHTSSGQEFTGTVVTVKQSTHVWGGDARDLKRSAETLEVRLDALLNGAALQNWHDTRALGIEVGDYVSWDTRTQILENGYIKSRHLDNKAGVAIQLEVTRAVLRDGLQLPAPVHFLVTTYEEIGHGAAHGVPEDTEELVAIDMAAIGDGQTSSELHCTLCVKDSGGPYDHDLSQKLRALARDARIDLKVDIYPYYASDATAAWRAGGDFRAALIGPGVDASHAFERTHVKALEDTARLLLEYLQS
ncbi:MAG: M42 family metallopeptidase [Pleurocapsa sp. SU_196_0]|nr:M42 family metallopeptidase [Pleurocapsa sp. SU_196_0]